MIVLLTGLSAAHASCDADDLVATLDKAREAFLGLELEQFEDDLSRAQAMVHCLKAPLPPVFAARLHEVQGMAAFLARDEQLSLSAFQAAGSADASLDIGGWLPEGHPISIEVRYSKRLDQPVPELLALKEGMLWVDGRSSWSMVTTWPSVLQHEVDGILVDSVLHLPGEPLPHWVEIAPEPLAPRLRRRIILGASTTVSAAAAGTLLAISAGHYARYMEGLPYDEMADIQRKANLSGAASAGMGAVALGTGAALVLTW